MHTSGKWQTLQQKAPHLPLLPDTSTRGRTRTGTEIFSPPQGFKPCVSTIPPPGQARVSHDTTNIADFYTLQEARAGIEPTQ